MSSTQNEPSSASDNDHWLAAMAILAMGQHDLNETRDYRSPLLKPIVRSVYPLFVLQYGLLMLVGVVANVLVGYHIMRSKLYRDVTHALVLNLVLSHCVQCLVVVPITLTVMLFQNWVLGRFLCYFLPMLQVSGVPSSTLSSFPWPPTFHLTTEEQSQSATGFHLTLTIRITFSGGGQRGRGTRIRHIEAEEFDLRDEGR